MIYPPRSWRELLPGAFAGMTAPFGIHPIDKVRAVRALHAAMRQGASMDDVIVEARNYLHRKGYSIENIKEEEARIKSFSPNPFKKTRISRAWLITLEDANKAPIVISIIKTQRSADAVREYVEQLYIDKYYSPREKIIYTSSRKNNPHPAVFEKKDGISYQGKITCGHSPFLYARIVTNLKFVSENNVIDKFSWDESSMPKN